MKQTIMYRQGDLLFTALSHLPEGLTLRSSQVIAEGEATGHQHLLLAGHVLEDAQGQLFLDVPNATRIVHQEHHAIHLQTGCYSVKRQREYTPQAIRHVRD